ncbi:MFS transporter [Gordonia sp. HY285]|uniref:MFS transporter n=1 Tax=Gordonia liuliyuniae TaxID=2911517 RepID=UPI001EFFCEA9|nr:MFS transporter [Gordonia liuliyuniae]MCF8612155.1 MFS transporter [Gordonia liuliyuniae]
MSAAVPGGRRWMTLFTLAWLVIWMVQLTPLQLLLPLQLDDQVSDGGDEWIRGVVVSGLILGIGGLAGVVAGPLAGAASDRTDGARMPHGLGGRRRIWAVGGTWLIAVSLILTGLAHRPWLVGVAWVGVCIGIGIASAAFAALIADQLPPDKRGGASAAIGSSQALGVVLGIGAVVLLGLDVLPGYLLLAVLMAGVGTWAAFGLPDPVVPRAQLAVGVHRDRWASFRDRDFVWMLTGRLVTNVGNALGTSLFLFFLMYGLGQRESDAEDNLLVLVVVYTVFVVGASIVSGLVADRRGHRRALTVAAALVQSVAGIVVVASPTFTATMVAAAIMGVGYGAFSTAGLAFATDLLPYAQDHGRDLGIVNVAAALGQLLGPVLGAGLVALVGGFWLVFAGACVLSILGGLITLRARDPNLV